MGMVRHIIELTRDRALQAIDSIMCKLKFIFLSTLANAQGKYRKNTLKEILRSMLAHVCRGFYFSSRTWKMEK